MLWTTEWAGLGLILHRFRLTRMTYVLNLHILLIHEQSPSKEHYSKGSVKWNTWVMLWKGEVRIKMIYQLLHQVCPQTQQKSRKFVANKYLEDGNAGIKVVLNEKEDTREIFALLDELYQKGLKWEGRNCKMKTNNPRSVIFKSQNKTKKKSSAGHRSLPGWPYNLFLISLNLNNCHSGSLFNCP